MGKISNTKLCFSEKLTFLNPGLTCSHSQFHMKNLILSCCVLGWVGVVSVRWRQAPD